MERLEGLLPFNGDSLFLHLSSSLFGLPCSLMRGLPVGRGCTFWMMPLSPSIFAFVFVLQKMRMQKIVEAPHIRLWSLYTAVNSALVELELRQKLHFSLLRF